MDEPRGTESPAAETEAEAQSEATLMPWIFGAFGILVAAAFAAWLIFGAHANIRQPAAAAPISSPEARPRY